MAIEGVRTTDQVQSGTTSLTGLATGTEDSALNDIGFDTFLKLLVTQLQNQDPLNPMDGTEFTGQIAQFSQLEQQIRGNDLLEQLAAAQDYSQQALAIGAIDREALIPGDTATLSDSVMSFGYKLDSAATNVDIEIVNSDGDVVKTIDGDGAEGGHAITWDGMSDDDVLQEDGDYTIRVSANDAEGTTVAATAYTYALVSEVTTDGEGTVSVGTTDGRTSNFLDVLSIRAWQG